MTGSATPASRRTAALAALGLMPLLSGCLAAVALPLVAGSALYVHKNTVEVRAATPTGPAQVLAAPAAARSASPLGEATAPQVVLTNLAELPPPSDVPAVAPANTWQPFVAYALAEAAEVRTADSAESALLEPGGTLLAADRRGCSTRHPAVILDLDSAAAPFAPSQEYQPAPGLAAALARLRQAGVVVLWLSELPASRVAEVAGTLRSSGLDPQGEDQLLLIRGPDDRKQVLREQANEDVCVVALAGDRRADFDELFDYLRDPEAAVGLDVMLGNGWFLVPQPLAAPAP